MRCFQTEDPKEPSRGPLITFMQKFGSSKMTQVFIWQAFKWIAPGSSLCQQKLLCDCLTNWIKELIEYKHVFSVAELFSTRFFPKWPGRAMNVGLFLLFWGFYLFGWVFCCCFVFVCCGVFLERREGQCVDCNIPRSTIPPTSVGLVCTLTQKLNNNKHFRKKAKSHNEFKN